MLPTTESRVVASLSPVPADLASQIRMETRADASSAQTHARWFRELACLHEVEVSPPPSRVATHAPARVVAWNAERGRDVSSLGHVLRAVQIDALLDAIESRAAGGPALVGGDLNTFSLGLSELSVRARLRASLEADPQRLVHPVPHEPLFERARARGYSWEECNAMSVATHRVAEPAPSARGGLKLDWLLARGLACSEAEVLEAVHPATGAALSDHEPIAVSCRL